MKGTVTLVFQWLFSFGRFYNYQYQINISNLISWVEINFVSCLIFLYLIIVFQILHLILRIRFLSLDFKLELKSQIYVLSILNKLIIQIFISEFQVQTQKYEFERRIFSSNV